MKFFLPGMTVSLLPFLTRSLFRTKNVAHARICRKRSRVSFKYIIVVQALHVCRTLGVGNSGREKDRT